MPSLTNNFFKMISKIILCLLIVLSSFKSICGVGKTASLFQGIADVHSHRHHFSIDSFLTYILFATVVHNHEHQESDDDVDHNHEHNHSSLNSAISMYYLPHKSFDFLHVEKSLFFESEPNSLKCSAYKFQIFRPPILIIV